jgi:outer membrane protein W
MDMPITKILSTLITLLLIIPSLCSAKTYDPLDFERPSSWYFSVTPGIALSTGNHFKHPAITDVDVIVAESAINSLTDNARPAFGPGYNIGAALGFHLDHNFRLDLAYSFSNQNARRFNGISFSADETSHAGTGDDLTLLTHTLMTNLYYDFYPYQLSVFPYVGVGLGVAFTKATAFKLEFPTYTVEDPAGLTTTVGDSGFDTRIAYQGTVGFHRRINDQFWLDLHYRWLNITTPKFYQHRFQIHQLNLGFIRYLSEDKRGRLTADYDTALGYQRSVYVHLLGGLSWLPKSDIQFSTLSIPVQTAGGFTTAETQDFNSSLDASFKLGYQVGGAIGFYINDYVRTEIAISQSRTKTKNATTTLTVDYPSVGDTAGAYSASGTLKTISFMANGYYDFTNVGQVYHPYAGLGLGIARIQQGHLSGIHNSTVEANVSGQTFTRFAAQFHLGMRKRFNKNWLIDYGYRFFVVPKSKILTGTLQNHALNVGIEYLFNAGDNV